MKMDSNVVSKEIKKLIKPYLTQQGFVKSSGRTFWKHDEEVIFVVNFQSYNSYHAETMGVTTFSFAVNFGLYWKSFPTHTRIKEKDGLLFPLESSCDIRHSLCKGIRQAETRFKTVWYVNENGDNMDAVLDDALTAIKTTMPGWFEKFSNKQQCIYYLQTEEENMDGTWGFGRKDSPARNLLIGYLAHWSGNRILAKTSLEKVLHSNCFLNCQDDIKRIIALSAATDSE